jgi:hypothetical protein
MPVFMPWPHMGGVHVGGIAGQEHPVMPVVVDLPFLAMESRAPADRGDADVVAHRARGDIADLGLLDRRGIRQLPAVIPGHAPVPAVAVGRQKSERTADVAQRETVTGGGIGQSHVGQHHRGEHLAAGEVDTQ